MKTVTRKFKVYSFDELSDEIKQKVIDKWYESETYDFLEDDIHSYLVDELDKFKVFSDIKLQYSLSCCQGDGLCFSANIDLINFLNNVYSKKLPEFKKSAINEYIYKCHSKGNTYSYTFASKNDIDFDYNYQDGIERKHVDKLWDDILEEIKEYYMTICKKLENYGYDIIDYRMDFKEFSELCDSNEYQFLENGKMFN